MLRFVHYLKEYFLQIHLRSFVLTTLFVFLLVAVNFTFGIEKRIYFLPSPAFMLLVFSLFYFAVFAVAYFFQFGSRPLTKIRVDRSLLIFLGIAPLLFSARQIHWHIPFLYHVPYPWSRYWSIVFQLPLKLLWTLVMLALIRAWAPKTDSFFGLTARGFKPGPYLIILVCLIPLVALASTQHDFQQMYPKVKNIVFINPFTQQPWIWKSMYEASYGCDFVTIEIFFRGFLVIGLSRLVGADAILPMAAFYCTIHFGKPLAECITSYFGGLALGVIAYRTGSIWGGLIIHLGLAWLMEIFGYLTPLLSR